MDEISIVVGLAAGIIIGFIIGWLLGKLRSVQPFDIGSQSAILSSLNSQIAEMKGKFTEIERSRTLLDQQRSQYDTQREQRLQEWMASTRQLFAEQAAKGQQVDEEKDKRIQAWMESTQKFFLEQKNAYTGFLEQQGKSREEIEVKRDAQIKDMSAMIQMFTRAVSGTKSRGIIGEEQLRGVLSNSIKAGVVVCNLRTDNGEVEFAWNLEDGKYIPIDCKLPDIFDLIDSYGKTEDVTEQKQLKKQIIDKIKLQLKNIQKYQNLSNTIESCILVVPEGILDIAPEMVGIGRESRVFICSYRDVFPVAYLLSEKYMHFKDQGDIGRYEQLISSLFQILDNINKKTETIQRGLVMITNANSEIKGEIGKGKQKISVNVPENESLSEPDESDQRK